MSRIREDLIGSVLVTLPGSSDPLALTAGQEVPEGVEVGDHVLEPGSSDSGAFDGSASAAAQAAAEGEKAAKAAAKKTEKAAKKAAKAAAPAPTTPASSTPAPTEELLPPPLNGAGSATGAWRDYATAATKAAGLEIEIPADAGRGDIVDALKSAGIRIE